MIFCLFPHRLLYEVFLTGKIHKFETTEALVFFESLFVFAYLKILRYFIIICSFFSRLLCLRKNAEYLLRLMSIANYISNELKSVANYSSNEDNSMTSLVLEWRITTGILCYLVQVYFVTSHCLRLT